MPNLHRHIFRIDVHVSAMRTPMPETSAFSMSKRWLAVRCGANCPDRVFDFSALGFNPIWGRLKGVRRSRCPEARMSLLGQNGVVAKVGAAGTSDGFSSWSAKKYCRV